MNLRLIAPWLLAGLLMAANTSLAAAAEEGFESLFNGQDLSGWDGNPKFWSVRDGAITGQTTAENPTRGNTFIVWKGGMLDDFELRLQFRIVGGNSGIQYRSQLADPREWVVGGYQADFEAGPTYSGILYEERGRGILAQRGQMTWIQPDGKIRVVGSLGKSEDIQAVIKKEDWNDYTILARGNQLTHVINGRVTVHVIDDQAEKAARSGILALQLHAGPPMLVQFKNLRLKRLAPAAKVAGGDGRAINGTWVPVEANIRGELARAEDLQRISVVIQDGTYRVQGADFEDRGKFTLDESTSPKSMDVTTDSGELIRAIYALDGDTLQVCYGPPGEARPDKFAASAERGWSNFTYKRKRD